VSEEYLIDVVEYWLDKEFSDKERHLRRVEKIEKLNIKK
jgi:ribose 5-phosphate isomerase RpiB